MTSSEDTNSHPEKPVEPEHYAREQVIATFRQFVERGITNPDDLDLNDPEVIEAKQILNSWEAEQQEIVKEAGTKAAELEYNFSRTVIFVDAGFSDPLYLEDVANDMLDTVDLPEAQEAGLEELATRIQAKIDEINAQLDQ
jgi:vacuolar-type H+-ATPase subunit I/STV1